MAYYPVSFLSENDHYDPGGKTSYLPLPEPKGNSNPSLKVKCWVRRVGGRGGGVSGQFFQTVERKILITTNQIDKKLITVTVKGLIHTLSCESSSVC